MKPKTRDKVARLICALTMKYIASAEYENAVRNALKGTTL